MAVNLSPIWGAGAQLLDNSGNVLSGGKIYTYAAGTTTQVTTYTSATGNTANSNPIVLNSAGRVPYEIWLTDGQNYKFVLKDSNDVLIGTWDNLSGINSNFIAYTNQQEIQTATAGQTVFNLTTMNYLPGTNSLSVFVDGVNQYGPGASYAYEETDSNTVTFTSGLHDGAEVKFTSSQIQNAGVTDASQITYDPPFTNSVATNVEAKLSETVSVKDFGAVGDGVTNDTAAVQAAIAYASSTTSANYKSNIFFPAGDYLLDRIELNSYRGFSFTGENTQDPSTLKTKWRFSGGSTDGALVLKSVSYIHFEGIYFDANSKSGLESLIQFEANASTAAPPLNRFSNVRVDFKNCVFLVQTGLASPPNQTIWVKNAGDVYFENCTFYTGNVVAVKLGKDSDVDPVTGLPTFANGVATGTYFYRCGFRGNIVREKSYEMTVRECTFAGRWDNSSVAPRIATSGGKLVTNEIIESCSWDSTGIGSYSGYLIESGADTTIPSTLQVSNCILAGAPVLVRGVAGDLTVTNNRGIPFGGINFNKFIQLESTAGNLVAENNNAESYITPVNNPVDGINAAFLIDLRTNEKLPVLCSESLSGNLTLTALTPTWVSVITSPTYFFGGQYVRISYSMTIKHADAVNAATYAARVVFNGASIDETNKRTTINNLDDYGVLSCTFITFIPAQTAAHDFVLQAQQVTGSTLGVVQGNSQAATTLTIELLDF